MANFSKALHSTTSLGKFLGKGTYALWAHGVVPFPLYLAREGLRRRSPAAVPASFGAAVAKILSHSGPAFIKLGQILATRSDLFPAPFCDQLETLYSQQAALPFAKVDQLLRRALPHWPFASVEATPLGTGSIGQVHRAELHDGRKVIVKIARPRVEAQLREDFEVIGAVLTALDAWPWTRAQIGAHNLFTLKRSAEELRDQLLRETDFLNEAENLRTFARRFRGRADVVVPEVFSDCCTREVLVMEELVGESLADLRRRAEGDAAAAQKVAALALSEILRQIFEDGTFHADPHGGNLLVLPDGRLGLIDLGLTGELTNDDRRRIAALVRAFVRKDANQILTRLLEFGESSGDVDVAKIRREVLALIEQNKQDLMKRARGKLARPDPAPGATTDRPADAGGVGGSLEAFVGALFQIASRNGIHIPSSTALLIKTFVTIEGVARGLDPELNLLQTAVPIILKSISKNWINQFAFWKKQ